MDMFSTQVMLGVVGNLKRLRNGLLSAFFAAVVNSTEETIAFDVDEGKRQMAPFVSPLVQSKVKKMRGQKVKSFQPAYIKQKARFNPQRALKRAMGEGFGTPLTPQQRQQAALSAELQDQIDYIDRRLEWMAVMGLKNSQIVVEGEDYPAVTVDFARDASLSGIAPGTLWTAAGAKPLDDLEKWSNLSVKASGSTTPRIVMDVDAWQAFRENSSVQKRLELIKFDAGRIRIDELQEEGLVLRGMVDGFLIYTYAAWYLDDAGVEQPMLASGEVIGVGAIEGTQYFGAIQDLDSLQAVSVFPKSWIDQDPSARWIQTQSAPLVVPKRINASWKADVN
ncbi:MAG TPA: major capsid protein [Gemmatimonadaceae bacterium]|nr:major capsid protein [Gemmatimonadaceae bacterium]